MLKDALGKALLTTDTNSLATSIKGFGDIGMHKKESLEPKRLNWSSMLQFGCSMSYSNSAQT